MMQQPNSRIPAQTGQFCGFPVDYWLGLTTLLQSMYALGYTRDDWSAYEEWLVTGQMRGFWDLTEDPLGMETQT